MYFGWYAYKPWENRIITQGDKKLSVDRNVFVRDLSYESSVKLEGFTIYIEEGYRFGVHSSNVTRLVEDSDYPFQVSMVRGDTINDFAYTISNENQFDSIENGLLRPAVYLKKPFLQDTIILKVYKLKKNRDSVGYVKVWDPR